MRVSAIFPAAGQSRRMNLTEATNKNFLKLDDQSILVHTLLTFSQVESIEKLIIAAAPSEVEIVQEMLEAVSNLKPFAVVAGGAERQYSIANALKVVPPDCEIVLVHDAARPLINIATINSVIESANIYGSAVAAVRVKDTIKIVDDDDFVIDTPKRSTLVAVQTPQGFRHEIIDKAYAQAAADNFLGTDDSSLVERLGLKVKIVMSDYKNIKITTSEDILIANTLLKVDDL